MNINENLKIKEIIVSYEVPVHAENMKIDK